MIESSRVFKRDKIVLNFSIEKCAEKSAYKLQFCMEDEYFETAEVKNKIENGTINFSETFTCEYDFSRIQKIKFTIQRWQGTKYKSIQDSKNDFYTLSSIMASKNSELRTKASSYSKDHEIIVISAENPNYSENNHLKNFNFVDYVKAGLQFNSYICIDFSGGREHNPNLKENQYLQAIQGFTDTLRDYIQTYSVLGYGAKSINNSEGINGKKYFYLNMESNPEIKGYANIFKKYKECLYKMNPDKKGYLSHAYEKIRKLIFEKYSYDQYNILFLLINDKPSDDDFDSCIDFLLEYSHMPVSLVIILMGEKSEEEKNSIRQYFSNKIQVSKKGITRSRNNASFYSMKACNFNNDILKNKCLREIPDQVLEYFKLNKRTPMDIFKISTNKELKNNINKNDINIENKIEKKEEENQNNDAYCAPNVMGEIKMDNKEEDEIEEKKEKEDKYKNTPGNDNESNINNNNINNVNNIIIKENPFKKNKLINETPKPYNPDENNHHKIIENPYKKKAKKEEIIAEKKYENKINIKIDNNDIEDKNYINEKKYINETPDGNMIKTKINNPFHEKEEKKYQNTPNPDEINNFQKSKKIVINPFKSGSGKKEENKNIVIDPFELGSNNKKEDDIHNKKYVNETPGNDDNEKKKIYINNPFQKKNNENNEDKNEKKEDIKVHKLGAHFKKKNINLSKFSTKSSNNDNIHKTELEYSVD